VAVGRAIVRQPKVFLFDEPLSNLDAKLRVQMRAEIIALHKRLAATIVYVTHDQVEAMTMGDKIVVMKGGLVHQVGSPLYVYHHPANKFVAGFIGSPPMNFLTERLSEQDGSLYAGKIRVADEHVSILRPKLGQEVTVGIRPEDFLLASDGDSGQMSGTVAMIEPLGGENHLHLDTEAGARFIATLDADDSSAIQLGERVSLKVKSAKLKYFDVNTEDALIETE
jgi:multiple sugar transport system ATP-binding protein